MKAFFACYVITVLLQIDINNILNSSVLLIFSIKITLQKTYTTNKSIWQHRNFQNPNLKTRHKPNLKNLKMLAATRLISTITRSYPRCCAVASRFTTTTPQIRHVLPQSQQFSTILSSSPITPSTQLLKNAEVINTNITRSVTKFSWKTGRRKTVKTVLRRFYRLNWGGWIRTMVGRHKHLWMKRKSRKIRLQRHVFCNASQSYMLDKMVNASWRKPKYYVDDPYEPYHKREGFKLTYTKPKPYFPPEEREQ